MARNHDPNKSSRITPAKRPRSSRSNTPAAAVSVWRDRRIVIYLSASQVRELAAMVPKSGVGSNSVVKLSGELRPTQMESPHAASYRCDLHVSTDKQQIPAEPEVVATEDATVPFPAEVTA